MKKFMIFFLMAFLLLSNSHSYAEKLNIEGVEAVNDFPIYSLEINGNAIDDYNICAWTSSAASVTITTDAFAAPSGYTRQTLMGWYVNGVFLCNDLTTLTGVTTRVFSFDNFPAGTYVIHQVQVFIKSTSPFDTLYLPSESVNIHVLPEPSVSIAGPTSGCFGQPITFQAIVGDIPQGYDIQWYRDGSAIAGQTLPTYSFNVPDPLFNSQNDTYQVGVSYSGCAEKRSPSFEFLNMAIPTVTIASPWSLCSGESVVVTADATSSAGLEPTRYVWNITGGPVYTSTNSLPISVAGNFSVSAQYENAACNTANAAFTVNLVTPTTLTINPSVTNVCEGNQYTLRTTPAIAVPAGTLYTWYRNGVEIPGQNLDSISETNTTPGNYTYRVKATYPQGCVTALSNPITVTVHAAPELTITGTPMFCSATANVSLSVNNYHAGSPSFVWYRDDVSQSVTTATISQNNVPAREYPYIYKVTVTDDAAYGACVVTKEYAVIINPTPSIQITVDDNTPCVNGEITFTPTMGYSTDYTYQWTLNGIATATSYIYNTSIGTVGTYPAYLTVTSTAVPACTAVSNILNITTTAVPATPVITPASSNVCVGGQVNLSTTVTLAGGVYTWYRNGVEISGVTGSSLSEILPTAGTYTYTVNVRTSHSGCVSANSTAATITVHTPEVVTISGTPIFCTDPATVTLNATPATGVTYQWYQDNVAVGTNSPAFSASVVSRDLPYIFRVQMTSTALTGGCISVSADYPVIINDNPRIEIAPQATSVCDGGQIKITPLAPYSQNVSYAWYRLGTGTPIATTYELNIPEEGTNTYYLVITSNNAPSCVATSNQVTITVVPPEEVTLAPTVEITDNIICEGGQFTLRASTDATNPVYTWYRNGVLIAGANLSTLTESPLAVDDDLTVYNYQVYVTSSEGCVSTATYSVSVRRNPIVELVANQNVCENLPNSSTNIEVVAVVDGLTGAIPGTFRWLEDGVETGTVLTTYNVQKPTRNYPYTYQLEYTSPYGCNSYSNVVNVMVHPRPQIEILAEETPVCIGGNIELSVNLSNNAVADQYTYQWYLGDTSTVHAIAGATLPTYTTVPTTAGSYNYWLIVDNYSVHAPSTARVRCEAAEYKTIVVNADPTVSLNAPTTPICDGGRVFLDADFAGGVPGGQVYTWYKNGVVIPGATLDTLVDYPTTVDQDTTIFTYRVEVSQTASGCASVVSAQSTVMVVRNPIVQIVANPNVCENLPTSATNIEVVAVVDGYTGAIPGTFRWLEDGVEQGGTLTTFNVQKPTRNYPYSYQLQYTSPNGCNAFSNVVEVMVHPRPQIQLLAQEDTICVGGDINLSVNLSNYSISEQYTYQWYTSDTATIHAINGATLPNYHTIPTTSGSYTYWLLVDNYAVQAPNTARVRCEAAEAITINVVADPVISVAISQDTICEGGEVIVTSSISTTTPGITGGEVYTWYKNDVIIPGAVSAVLVDYPVTIDGNITNYIYRVEVAQTASGCASVNTAQTSVQVNPNPSVQIEGDPIICDGSAVSLTANVNDEYLNPAFTYQWRLFNADIAGATSPAYSHVYADTNNPYIFTVLVTNTNGCQKESEPFYVYVNTAPVVEVTSTETTICTGGEVTMTTNLADYNSPSLTYQWYTVDQQDIETAILGASEPTLTIIPNVTTHYRVRVIQTTSACVATGNIQINVNLDPTIAVAINHSVICEGGEVILTSNVTGGVTGGEVYTWYKNDVIIPGAVSAVLVDYPVTVNNDITKYIYRVEVAQTAAGCASVVVAKDSVLVHPNPTVVISGDPIVCTGTDNIALHANINDQYLTSNLGIQWRLFNTNISGATGVNYTGTYGGSDNPYIFTVVVSNPLGCVTTSAPFEVLVNVPPVVELTSNETNICAGGPVTMTANLGDYNATDLIYRWFSVNGSTDTPIYGATESTLTITPSTTTLYKVQVTQITSGCTDNDTITINVNEDPTIAVTISQDTICEGGEVILTSSIIGGGVTGGEVYTWYKNNVIIPGAVSAVLTDYPVTVDGNITNYIYRVEVAQTASGCASVNVAQSSVQVNPNPSVQIQGDPIICDGSAISLQANVNDEYLNPALTYQWRLFNADITGATNSYYTQQYDPTDNPYTFTVLTTNTNGCQRESAPFNVYVNSAPVVQVTSTETTICTGGEVTLTTNLADYNSPNLVYQWYIGSQPIPGASEPTLTVIPSSPSTTYRVVVTQTTSACVATGEITITVNPDPVITGITISDNYICEGGQVTVTATSTNVLGTPVYTWYRNGIQIEGVYGNSFTESPDAIDADVTLYTYSAIVTTNVAGCQSLEVEAPVLTVYGNPVVAIAGDANICEGDSVFLTGFVDHVSDLVGTLTYTWFESGQQLDNNAYGISNPASQYLVDFFAPRYEPYVFTVRVTRENGCTTMSEPFYVYVHTAPIVNITSTESNICEGGQVTMTANLDDYTTDFMTYQWYTETYVQHPFYTSATEFYMVTDTVLSLIPGATQQDYTTDVNDTTTYVVRAQQTHSLCADYDRFTVYTHAIPVITSITVTPATSVCSGGEVTLTANISGGVTGGEVYTWYKNGVIIPNANTQSITESLLAIDNDNTVYTYNVVVTQTAAACQSILNPAVAVAITVYPNPTVVISGDPIVCAVNSNIVLTANLQSSIPDLQYTWFEDNMPVGTGATLTLTRPARDYAYNYHVVVYNPLGCSAISEVFNVNVNANPVVNISADQTTICIGGSSVLTADLGDLNTTDLTYQWYIGTEPILGATLPTLTVNPATTTTYRVVVTQTTSGCVGENTITITVNQDPVITLISIVNPTLCEGGQIEVSATTNPTIIDGAVFTWYKNGVVMNGINGASFTESPVAVDNDVTTYTYGVSVAYPVSGCQSNILTSEQQVTVYGNPTVVIEGNPLVCDDSTFTLTAHVNDIVPGTTITYQWRRFNQDIPGATQQSITATEPFQFGNTYMYTVVVNTEYTNGTIGCVRESDPFYIAVGENPHIDILASDTVACLNGEVTLTAVLGNAYLDNIFVTWYKNGEEIYGAHQLTYVATITGTATYYAVVSASGCTATTESIEIHLINTPVVGAVIASNNVGGSAICEGGEIEVTAYLSNGVNNYIDSTATYTWFRNGFLMEGVTGPWFSESLHAIDGDTTHYTYAVIVNYPTANCVSEIAFSNTITVTRNPIVIINGLHDICQSTDGQPNLYLSAYINGISNPDNTTIFKWYKNGVYQNNPNFGLYYTENLGLSYQTVNYMVEIINGNGCSAFSDPFEIFVHPTPVANITVDQTTVCNGGQVTLTAHLNDYNEDEYIYQWYLNGTSVANVIPGATQLTYTTPALTTTGTYYFRVIQRHSGCNDLISQVITVLPDPQITNIQVSATAICDGGEVVITANTANVNGTATFTWFRNGILLEGINGASFTQTLQAIGNDVTTYTYTALVSTNIFGCQSAIATAPVITVSPNPSVVIAGEPIVCEGVNNIVLFANSLPATGLQYQWFLNNVAITDATSSTLTTTQPASTTTYVYTVQVSGATGCVTMSAPYNVTVNASPIVNVTATENNICVGGEVTLTATLVDWNAGMLTYQWYHNSEIIPGATNLTYTTTIDAVGYHNYQIVVTQITSGCTGTASTMINVAADPQITGITITEPFICEGGQVTVTATATGIIGTPVYTWYKNGILMPGINGASFTESPAAIDGDLTTYTYSAIVTSSASGCQSTEVNAPVLTVYGNPVVAITGDMHICENEMVNLMAFVDHVSDNVGNLTYTWFESGQQRDNLVNGIPANSQIYTEYWYPNDQAYVFTVRVTRENGCTTLSQPFNVYVHENPVVNVTATEETVCEGGQVTMTANLDNYNTTDITYQWFTVTTQENQIQISATEFITVIDTIVTNIPGATLSTYTTNVNTTSQYGVLVTQTISGCTATDRIIITANPIPVVTGITVTQNGTICEGGQVTLTAQIQGGVAGGEVYTWYRNGIIIPGAITASITESPLATDGNVTIYTYNVTVAQTAAACQSILNADVAAQVTVNPNPSVTISGDPIICETANIQLLANLNDLNTNTGMTYEWRLFNQTLGINTPELSIARPASDNPYIFTVLVTNQYGCQVESTPYYVYVNSNPVVQVTATEATICDGGTTTLTANLGDYNVPNLVFAWTENGVTIPGATTSQVTVNPTATSVYSVSVVQTTSACSATGTITVNVVADPIITSVTVNESQVCEGGQITVIAAIEGGIQGGEVFTWFRNGIIVPNVTGNTFTESPLVIGDDITVYNYSVQVTQTASGCQSVISQPVTVTVYPLATVQVMVTGNTTICEGGSVQLTANVNPTTTNTTYQWFVDNVLIPGATAATYTVTDAQARQTAYQYTVLVSQYIGCNVTSAPQAITVVADPVVNVTVNNPSICVGGTATLTANVQGGVENINGIGAFTFNWYSTTSPTTSLGTNAILEVTGVTPQLETYWVVVTSPYGCATTAYYYNHEVVADPTVAIAIGNGYSAQVCEGGQTMLVANVAGGLGQPMYQWYKNGILLVGETNASIMTTPLYSTQTADYTVNVTMTGVGCNATANFNAHNIVVASPVVAITGNTNTCPGGTVTLVASVTGGVTNDTYTYQWFKVSNGIPTAINGAVNATYTTSPLLLGDSYEYYVQISSFVSGCSATSGTVQANVVAEPTVAISGANSVCQGGVLTLTANVNGGVPGETYVYTWTYQQGTQTGTYQTTTNVFQLPTTLVANDVASPYVFNVTIMSANYHCDAVSASHIINIYPQPQATITVDNQALCLGGSVTFTANVVPVGTYNYQWTVNGVLQGNNTPYITRNNLPTGVTNVTVVATPNNSNAACTAVASKSVTVVADPVVTVSSNVTAMCAGGTINLGVQAITLDPQVATGNYTYQWRENGVEVSNVIGSTFNKNLTTPGTYTYALRITQNDNLGCASNWSNEITVSVAAQPVATINPAGLGMLDICSGGEVNLNATVTNANLVHGTMNYTWYSNNTNTGVTTNPYVQTLNTVGTYNYYAKLTPSGFACNPVNTNVLTYNVVADPTWTNISVQYPEICAGETVQLSAGVQGGVEDGSGNTNGTIQWMVWAENGNPQPVLGGLGGVSYDTPSGTGNYFYQPTYNGQLGDGCNILVNPITPVVVNERPTATFANGDGSIVCGNDPNSFATLTVTLTGNAPFTFTLTGSNGYSQNFYTSLNTFYIYLNPTSTGSYSIANLHDANCEAVAYPAPITVIVSHIEVLDLLAEVCGETTPGTLPRVQMDVNIFSVAPGMEPTAFITFNNPSLPEMNTQSPIYTEGTRTYIEFAVPNNPGDYEVIITIDGCSYPATVRVLAGQYNFGGTDALVQQRWDDVVVVNNNPETNGGHNFVSFQWYKNGVLIPGATNQYYQEVGGLNGEYAVELIAETDNGLVTFKTCDMFFVSENLMKVYPVPARTQESVTIEAKLTDEQLKGAVLDIYDAKGAFVKQVEVNDIIIRIDGFTTPGAYFGRITTGTNEIKTVKFVIVK